MGTADVGALLVGPGADLRHLTGYGAHRSERMTLLVARQDGRHRLIVPQLERPAAAVATQDVPIVAYAEGQDPADVVAEVLDGIDPQARVGVGDQLWATFFLDIQKIWPDAEWIAASSLTRHLRMAKDPDSLDRLRQAAAAIDAVHRRMPTLLRTGMTERQAGTVIAAAMRDEGHDTAAFVIVGSGPNGASPHHEQSDREIVPGDAVVIDIGGPVQGWFSDCTRNYVMGHAPEGYHEAFEVLRRAQREAVDQVRPGIPAKAVDAAARDIIVAAGYGDAFVHRTGHGIGLEVHEEPYITADNDLVLEPGMTFSVEPGIYLEGRFGLRIEDIVAVTQGGVERLNTVDAGLVTIPT